MSHFREIWTLAGEAIALVDPAYAAMYTKIAVSKNFVGSPHIDTYDQAPQYAASFGNFCGGALMVEAAAREVVAIDTKGRMAKCDGRFPHWYQ